MLIFGSAFLFFYFLQVRQQPSTAAGIAILALLLSFRLIYYVNRTNRILGNFLSYMHENDPTMHFSVRYVKQHFKGLKEIMEKLIGELKENRIELELQTHYLQAILNNVSTGILCFDDSGQIRTMNRAAASCLKMDHLKNLADLDRQLPGLGTRMLKMRSDAEITETVAHGGKSIQLAIHSSQILLKKERIHIIALNDISNQMEEQEILAWKKLIRVINHEIMNSMTPIITLSMAIRRKLAGKHSPIPTGQSENEAIEDAMTSASIIAERSKGLVEFIERYKKLTSLPPMKTERFPAGELFEKLEQLYKEELLEAGIRLKCPRDCHAVLEADRQMMEQVMINLVKNSVEALRNREDPEIELSCYIDARDHICLSVRDNGEGIPADKLKQVFVPFFTTRMEGSGIGLSLCRQMIRLHHGRTDIESVQGEGTRVVITL
jgi:two-component system, NtrC family, nitrogen regulation sensor histidine kinase NtrY